MSKSISYTTSKKKRAIEQDVLRSRIGARLKTARDKLGMSQEDLLERINIDSNRPIDKRDGEYVTLEFERYRRWEDGTNMVSNEWIPTLCKHLECDVGFLFGDYEELTRQKASIHNETGLNQTAIEVLQLLNIQSEVSTLRRNVLETINLLLEHSDERKLDLDVVPLLEYISAYLNCAPEDKRIVSVELDGSVRIYENADAFENEPGEAISGDYMRQIVKTRLEQRVMDELRNLWKEKNGESKRAFYERMRQDAKKRK